IQDYSFSPPSVTVAPGATVCWTNNGDFPHTATSSPAGGFDTGTLGYGQSARVQFPTAGTYDYLCTIHPFMTGRVGVSTRPQPPPPSPPPARAAALTVSRFSVQVERRAGSRWLVARTRLSRAASARLSLLRGRRTVARADRRRRAGANVVRLPLPRRLAHGRYVCALRVGSIRRTASLHL